MNQELMRIRMNQYRKLVSEEALCLKQSSLVPEKLHVFYSEIPSDQRPMANQVISEWVLSDDEAVRFDALALIDDFSIVAAESALRELSNRLTSSAEPGAPYERQKVIRIQEGLVKR